MEACDLSAAQWELYTLDGADEAAENLNDAVNEAVNEARQKLKKEPRLDKLNLAEEARDKVYKVMSKYSKLGARDTEPECNLVAQLEFMLGLEAYTLER